MTTIITGASKGIGRSVAEIFAANGSDLLLCSRSEIDLYRAMEDLLTRYPSVSIRAKPADLSDSKQSIAFGEWCLESGTPQVLVNNAGNFEPGSVHNEADGNLEKQIASNLYSAYHLTRTLLPPMMKEKKGHIFNMCSIASIAAYPNGGAYSISKFALYGFSKNLREEMKPHGIRVTHVIPGAVLTDSWKGFDNSGNRIMEASDVAKMIYAAYSLSEQANTEEIVLRPQPGDL